MRHVSHLAGLLVSGPKGLHGGMCHNGATTSSPARFELQLFIPACCHLRERNEQTATVKVCNEQRASLALKHVHVRPASPSQRKSHSQLHSHRHCHCTPKCYVHTRHISAASSQSANTQDEVMSTDMHRARATASTRARPRARVSSSCSFHCHESA